MFLRTFFVELAFAVSLSICCEAQTVSEFSEADAAFHHKNFAAARELYTQTREKLRSQQWFHATVRIVRCCNALGDTDRAVQEYFLLCRVDSVSVPLDCMPLPWFVPLDNLAGTQIREKTAEEFLDPLKTRQPGHAATLLAAGILSVSRDSGRKSRGLDLLRDMASTLEAGSTEAVAVDKKSDTARNCALLARFLLWKQRIPTLQQRDLKSLERFRAQLPETLQAGPCFLLGQAARQVGDHESAVLYWMRVAVLYPEQRQLARESLREAAKSLEKLGRNAQADHLRREAGE